MNYKTKNYANKLIALAKHCSGLELVFVQNGNDCYFQILRANTKEYIYFVVPSDMEELRGKMVPLFSWYLLNDNRYLIAMKRSKKYLYADLLPMQKEGLIGKLNIKQDKVIL